MSYILVGKGLAENTFGEPSPRTLAMRKKAHLTLDNFPFDKSSFTPGLTDMVNRLASSVAQSWSSKNPIMVIRLTGHTDSSGPEKYNEGLGYRRSQAVAAALQDKLKGFLDRVKILVNQSPGETDPTADNRTEEGRARNRRVEVFIETGVINVPPPKQPKVNWTVTLPPESVIVTKPDRYSQEIPEGPRKRTIEDALADLLPRSFPPGLRSRIRDAFVKGSCTLLEEAFAQAGGTLSQKQKEDLRKKCLEAAKKPIR